MRKMKKKKIDWDKEYKKEVHWSGKLKKVPEEIKKLFSITKKYDIKGKALDIGCGTGEKTALIAKKFETIGIDISENAIKKAKEEYSKVKFKEGSAENLPFKNKTFDVVFSRYALNFTNLEKSAKEVYRVLKDKGIVCLFFITKTISKEKETEDSSEKMLNIYKKLPFKFLEKEILWSIDKKPSWHKHKKLMLVLKKVYIS